MVHKSLKRVEAHYESSEMPFGKVYEWHSAHVAFECDYGEKLVLTAASTITTCPCGADLGTLVRDLREREAHLPDRVIHPWSYDAKEQTQQHSRDEAAYPEGSPWRYNDVTADDEG
jgi:hypothetical protein